MSRVVAALVAMATCDVAVAGCSASHGGGTDSTAIPNDAGSGAILGDARPTSEDTGSRADAALSAPDAHIAGCTIDVDRWRWTEIEYGRSWGAMLRARGGSQTWLVLVSSLRPDDEPIWIARVDDAREGPRLGEPIAVADTEGWKPRGVATDGERVVIVAIRGDEWALLAVRADGSTEHRAPLPYGDPRYLRIADIAIREEIVAIATDASPAHTVRVELRELGGALIREDVITPSSTISVGAAGALFGVVASPYEMHARPPAHMYVLDTGGLVERRVLDTDCVYPHWDGEIVVCASREHRLESFAGPLESRGSRGSGLYEPTTIAVGASGRVLATAGYQYVDSGHNHGVFLSLESGRGWREVDGSGEEPHHAQADEGSSRLGAFFLDSPRLFEELGMLRWVGLACR